MGNGVVVKVGSRYPRALAAALALVALTGCGGGGSGFLGLGPPTPAQILAKPAAAGIKEMHMKITGKGTNGTALAGEGTLELAPKKASKMVVTAAVGLLGNISIEYVTVDGTDYSRIGSGKYDAKPTTAGNSQSGGWADGKNPKLVGEETVNGDKVWHVKATDSSGDDFELWVREKDGYPLRYKSDSSSGFSMEFSAFNVGDAISAPSADQVKPAPKNATGTVGQAVKLTLGTITIAQVNKNFTPDNQFETPKAGNSFIAVEILYEATGTDKLSYNPFDWKVKDGSGAEFTSAFVTKTPELHSGDLNPGEKVRGWEVFEVPTGDPGLTINAKIGDDSISVTLPA
jgi:hypothetical protein